MPRQASARVRLPEEECWDPGLFVVNSSSSETEVSSQWRFVKQTFESQLVLAVAPLGSKQVLVSTRFTCVHFATIEFNRDPKEIYRNQIGFDRKPSDSNRIP